MTAATTVTARLIRWPVESRASGSRSASVLGVNGFCSSGTPPEERAVHGVRVVGVARHVEDSKRGFCCSSRAARFGPLRPGMTTSVMSRWGLTPVGCDQSSASSPLRASNTV